MGLFMALVADVDRLLDHGGFVCRFVWLCFSAEDNL